MIEHKIIKSPEDKQNEFVYNSPKSSIFQTSYMTNVYDRTKNYKSLTLTAVDDVGDIRGSLVAINFTEKSAVLKSMTTHTTIRGGPIVDDSNNSFNVCSYLLKNYEKIRKKTLYTRIYPLKKINAVSKAAEANKYNHESYLNFLIDLKRPIAEIWMDFHKGRRYNINRAENRFNLQAVDLSEKEEISQFYALLKETHRNAAIPLADISLFNAIYDILVPKKLARFVFTKKEGAAIACMLILTYKDEIYDWYAGALKDSLSYYPNDFLVWQVLKWGAENGYKLFDFGGAGKPDEKYGVRDFKKQFGGDLVNYGRYTKVHSPLKLNVASKGFSTLQKIKKSGLFK